MIELERYAKGSPFLQYDEPNIVQLLILISFFTLLWVSAFVSSKLVRAGMLGPIFVGVVYGAPLFDILREEWQETFLYLGYLGLILIIFEGGLSARLDLLLDNLTLSACVATTGVLLPIVLSYLLLYWGFGYGSVETFIIGAALSATSLGTTFAVMQGASSEVDLSQTRVGAVLISAAVMDDVTGLIMSSVIDALGDQSSGGTGLGWLIGRPMVAAVALAVATPVLSKYVLAPCFRRYIEYHFAKFDHVSNILFMIVVLTGFISVAAYAGTSVLFGAFLAGGTLSYLPSKDPDSPFAVTSREEGESREDKSPTFLHSFEYFCSGFQKYLLEPLFFASIGFAVPFLDLWVADTIWKGICFSLLMFVGKVLVGVWIPFWGCVMPKEDVDSPSTDDEAEDDSLQKAQKSRMQQWEADFAPGCLLGFAMVARGEIGLLIVEIGYNRTRYMSQAGFAVTIWAILLNTMLGPVAVGLILAYRSHRIVKGHWGLVSVQL